MASFVVRPDERLGKADVHVGKTATVVTIPVEKRDDGVCGSTIDIHFDNGDVVDVMSELMAIATDTLMEVTGKPVGTEKAKV